MRLANWILILFCLAWFATFSSQSLVDFVDICFIVTALLAAIKNKDLQGYFQSFKPALIWIIWILIVMVGLAINVGLTNAKPWIEALEFRWILTFLSMIYLTRIFFKSEENAQEKILLFLSPIALCMNVAAISIYYVKSEIRAGGILNAVMSFSHNLAMLFCFFFFSLILIGSSHKINKKMNLIQLSIVISSGALLVATLTRGAWIGSVVGILIGSILIDKKFFLKVLMGVIVISTVLLTTQPKINNRFFGKTFSEVGSNNERIALWKGNFRIIQDNPIWGVGYQQNKHHLRKYYDEFGYPPEQRISHAHNQYLQYWGGTGALGLMCFLGFLFFLIWPVVKSIHQLPDPQKYFQLGLLAAIICFLVGGLTEANFNIAKNRMLFLLIAAWAYSLSFHKKSKA